MARSKSKAVMTVADGKGGMVQVQDRRFEQGDWPIQFEVAKEDADAWMRYYHAEIEQRGWSQNHFAQSDGRENSGSFTVRTGTEETQFAVVWDRKRGGPLKVRARSVGTPELPVSELSAFFESVNARRVSPVTQRFFRWAAVEYDGLPWLGEIWLDDTLRLGPPSRQYERALLGPRAISVSASVAAIGPADAVEVFRQDLQEVCAFLSVITGHLVQQRDQRQTWTWAINADGTTACDVRQLGYIDPNPPTAMPEPGTSQPVPLRPVTRPDFSQRGIFIGTTNEQALPSDVIELWRAFRALSPEKRRQFLQASAKWQEALMHWKERSTLSFALLVVACEALKPPDRKFKDHQVYEVVEALLGSAVSARLKEEGFRPQDVRNAHLHAGAFRGDEMDWSGLVAQFYDPTFDQARRELAPITQEAIIEWLRRGGVFAMSRLKQRNRTVLRWARENVVALLCASSALGVVLGWLVRGHGL